MKLVVASFLTLVLTAGSGCDLDRSFKPSCDPCAYDEIIIFDDIRDITLCTDPLTVTDVSIRRNTLYLTVSYGGGCREHEFELYGASAFLESYPAQASLFLSHDGNEDLCDALIRAELAFDLLPLKKAYRGAYSDGGPLLLRLHGPGVSQPIRPLILYEF